MLESRKGFPSLISTLTFFCSLDDQAWCCFQWAWRERFQGQTGPFPGCRPAISLHADSKCFWGFLKSNTDTESNQHDFVHSLKYQKKQKTKNPQAASSICLLVVKHPILCELRLVRLKTVRHKWFVFITHSDYLHFRKKNKTMNLWHCTVSDASQIKTSRALLAKHLCMSVIPSPPWGWGHFTNSANTEAAVWEDQRSHSPADLVSTVPWPARAVSATPSCPGSVMGFIVTVIVSLLSHLQQEREMP